MKATLLATSSSYSNYLILLLLPGLLLAASGCEREDEVDNQEEPVFEREAGPDHGGIYSFAGGCYHIDGALSGSDQIRFLATDSTAEGFHFEAESAEDATPFYFKATDLGTYLFYDPQEHYLVIEEGKILRREEILSDLILADDSFLPGVQFELEVAPDDETRFRLRHLRSARFLGMDGLVDEAEEAAILTFYEAQGCSTYPELSLDAQGEVEPHVFADGSLYGFVDTHSHILSNFGFGGAGIFHGAPFHPFGVPHALPTCEHFHGPMGRQDLFGYGFDRGDQVSETELIGAFALGETPEDFHETDGWPEFTEWPSAHFSSTHQAQYYRWLERAYLSGLRLVVNHATSNQIICELLAGSDVQPTRYSCNDMVAADRTLEESRRMERYIDAQHGGPGKGWFRIVESPEEAREVIAAGKMAVVLGLEVSNLFDCFLVPPGGGELCTEEQVVAELDRYYEKGVRILFPVHKFDNAFSAGDGQREIIELANFAQTGHWSNFTDDCPDIPSVFDVGNVAFGSLNEPRDDYFADPPVDMSGFADNPIRVLLNHVGLLTGGPLQGDYCQNAGLTELGEFLMLELMKRGMMIEIDHFPRRSYLRAFEMLQEYDYPAAGTHGNNNRGALYELGGISKFNFARCSDPDRPGSRIDSLRQRLDLIAAAGGYPAEGFGFDLNGFAGAPGPRFGERTRCAAPQENPVTYPFTSFDGQITFTEPQVGNRTLDFNTEGMAHIGLVAELVQDVLNDGVEKEELEPLFRSAEGYIRFWERSIERGAAIRAQLEN